MTKAPVGPPFGAELSGVKKDVGVDLYSDLVKSATESLMLSNWSWTSDLAARLLLSEKFVHGVDSFAEKVRTAAWPGEFPELEGMIKSLSDNLSEYIEHFMGGATLGDNAETPGEVFYFEDRWWESQDSKWRDNSSHFNEESMKWRNQTAQLFSNVVEALNCYAKAVRKYLDSNYLAAEGTFAVNEHGSTIN